MQCFRQDRYTNRRFQSTDKMLPRASQKSHRDDRFINYFALHFYTRPK